MIFLSFLLALYTVWQFLRCPYEVARMPQFVKLPSSSKKMVWCFRIRHPYGIWETVMISAEKEDVVAVLKKELALKYSPCQFTSTSDRTASWKYALFCIRNFIVRKHTKIDLLQCE